LLGRQSGRLGKRKQQAHWFWNILHLMMRERFLPSGLFCITAAVKFTFRLSFLPLLNPFSFLVSCAAFLRCLLVFLAFFFFSFPCSLASPRVVYIIKTTQLTVPRLGGNGVVAYLWAGLGHGCLETCCERAQMQMIYAKLFSSLLSLLISSSVTPYGGTPHATAVICDASGTYPPQSSDSP
jgi:hypothetical protein